MPYKFLFAFSLCLFLFSGAAFASFAEGQAAYKKKDWNNAVRFLLPLAKDNHDGALLIIGQMYANGQGVPTDFKKAFELFQRSADQGNAEAMVSVAALYSAGKGVEKNMKAAFEWFRKAAEMDYSIAQFSLGIALTAGDEESGLPADLVEAYKWLTLSTRNTILPNKITNTAKKLAGHARNEEMNSAQRLQADRALSTWKPKKWDELANTHVYWNIDTDRDVGAAPEEQPAPQEPETAPENNGNGE